MSGSSDSSALDVSTSMRDATDALSSADLRVAELGAEREALKRRIGEARRAAQHWKRVATKLFLRARHLP